MISTDELEFYLLIFKYLALEEEWEQDDLTLVREIEKEDRRRNRRPRVKRAARKHFKEETSQWSDATYKRYFRLSRESFDKLCTTICSSVGEDVFRSENWLKDASVQSGAPQSSGGHMCGEVRVSIFLRILAGASYLDLMLGFQVSHDPVYQSFRIVTGWLNKTFDFPLVAAIENEDLQYLEDVSSSFAHGSSGGAFMGCIGALDGIAIKIKRPTRSKSIPNPGNYYCRKAFFALNCQAICDANKKISWISSKHLGSTHDSVAFTDTKLYELLLRKQEFLHDNQFFIIGDSAYNLESFLLVPFPQPGPRSPEDAYNYYHSSCRIKIECTFGEVIMRFGLFWRPLQFDIASIGDILTAACLLHNFMVDERSDDDDNIMVPTDTTSNLSIGPGDVPVYTDANDETARPPPGRPTVSGELSRERGRYIRESLSTALQVKGLTRPLLQGMKRNEYGMVYMEY